MSHVHKQVPVFNYEVVFDLLFTLESIIKITQSVCKYKEEASMYYNLFDKTKLRLSEERNDYINMLDLALEKIGSLKTQFISLEKNSYDSCR